MKKGRYREFYQCDFDIVGVGATMAQDAEVLKIVVEILTQLEFNFVVKINHRKLLDSFLDISGCPSDKFRTVSSSIDKLDKEEWSKVRTELIEEKGISEDCANKIGEYVKLNGHPRQVLEILKGMEMLQKHAVASKVLEELEKLVNYVECFGIIERLNLDMSLARGLDYYTGLVYEAVVVDGQVGSIAGGGRYDELIMRLNNSNQPTPAVGVSLGVERLFTVIEERYKAAKSGASADQSVQSLLKSKANSVLIAQAGSSDRFNLMQERFKICSLLWTRGINAETSYKEKSDPKGQAGYASQQGIRWMVWVGDSEMAEGKAKVKDLTTHTEEIVAIETIPDFILAH
jgi:histidyl-tRNA synthetase